MFIETDEVNQVIAPQVSLVGGGPARRSTKEPTDFYFDLVYIPLEHGRYILALPKFSSMAIFQTHVNAVLKIIGGHELPRSRECSK
jgi:hypothetical protein